jgi:hypothetical protein
LERLLNLVRALGSDVEQAHSSSASQSPRTALADGASAWRLPIQNKKENDETNVLIADCRRDDCDVTGLAGRNVCEGKLRTSHCGMDLGNQ